MDLQFEVFLVYEGALVFLRVASRYLFVGHRTYLFHPSQRTGVKALAGGEEPGSAPH